MSDKYDCLKLENQICFPLYVCSKEIVRRYKPFLEKLDLTYTQYILMMVLWEEKEVTSKALGDKLFLDSGTLTPVLKKLEEKEYLSCKRLDSDRRNLLVTVTEKGMALREEALDVPASLMSCVDLDGEDAVQLYTLLHKLIQGMK